MSEYQFAFEITTPVTVEEAYDGRVVLSGTFIRLNSPTKNGREYLVEEGDQIATGLVGMPVYFGSDPLTNKHLKGPAYLVGRVFKTLFDKANKTIKGFVEIWNTKSYPDIVAKIKPGWGFSIGGKALDLKPTGFLNKLGRAVMKVIGMAPNHLQLLPPTVKRGQDEAMVEGLVEESVPIEETLMWDPCPWGVCELPEETLESPPEPEPEPEPKTVEETPVVQILRRKIYIVSEPDTTPN